MKKSEGGTGKVPDAWYEMPVFVFQNPWTITAPNADIPMPPNCERLDYELEIAAVILKKAKDVSEAEARDYIAGYTIWNDWSARDVQKREMAVGLGPSKGKDFANTLGPWIATVDEFKEDKYVDGRLSLDMKVTVNGELYGHDNSKMMSWSFEQMLVHASRASVVGPGDVLGSGTASNGGSLAEKWSRNGGPTPPPLKVGDVVEMEIEGLGSIKNTIVASDSPNHQIPKAVRTYSEDQL
jgi:2-keto-4-pentenoate hydratase/2-oxohepta-3-ene-1,7-dioic acid hydratase in catechol pathway